MRERYVVECPVGGIQTCRVCGALLTYRARSPEFHTPSGGECETGCQLFLMRGREARCGFEWRYSPWMSKYKPLEEETKALWERRLEWWDFSLACPMDWLVFADWLDEHGFPLNAAGIRHNFQTPFEEYKT